jgi:hypothetical protein
VCERPASGEPVPSLAKEGGRDIIKNVAKLLSQEPAIPARRVSTS